jgi:hypothetical protein
MTTHDEHTDTTSAQPEEEASTVRSESPRSQADSPASADERSSAATHEAAPATGEEPSTTHAEPSEMGTGYSTAGTEPSIDEALFAQEDLSELRSRWDDVQAAFVDDPKDCVQKADSLVAEVVEQLTTGFTEARSRLEAQWARGEEASTEDLRVALKRYREFFQRLLAV